MNKEEISKVLHNNLKVVPKAYDIHGENYVIQFTENDCNNEVLIKTK